MPINSANSYKRLRLVAARINSEAIVIVYRCRPIIRLVAH